MKTKLNYTDNNGKRTSITLNSELVATWKKARFAGRPWESEDLRQGALLDRIANSKPYDGEATYVEAVENHLLREIQDEFTGLLAKVS